MRKFLGALLLILPIFVFAQTNEKFKESKSTETAIELAKQAIESHGGEKFKKMQSLVVRGTADVSGSPTATFPASFLIVFSGEKYVLEVNSSFQSFKQVFDGQQTYSTIAGFNLPPINRLGLPLLQRVGQEGFTVSELPEKKKKKLGFRITSPEGYYTDFFLDEKTKRIKAYEASYSVGNRTVTTAVEIDKFRDVDGIILPERYSQRFDLGTFTVYSDFRAKEILVNTQIPDDVFKMK